MKNRKTILAIGKHLFLFYWHNNIALEQNPQVSYNDMLAWPEFVSIYSLAHTGATLPKAILTLEKSRLYNIAVILSTFSHTFWNTYVFKLVCTYKTTSAPASIFRQWNSGFSDSQIVRLSVSQIHKSQTLRLSDSQTLNFFVPFHTNSKSGQETREPLLCNRTVSFIQLAAE